MEKRNIADNARKQDHNEKSFVVAVIVRLQSPLMAKVTKRNLIAPACRNANVLAVHHCASWIVKFSSRKGNRGVQNRSREMVSTSLKIS